MATTQEMDSIPNTFAKRKFLLGASAVLAVGVVAGVGAKLLAGGSAGPFKANAINTGDTAWVLTAAALVMIMIPAVGFFYWGMVRGNNVVSVRQGSEKALTNVTV